MNNLVSFLNYKSEPSESIDEVRTLLLHKIIIVLNLLGIPVVILGIVEALILKQYYTSISYLVFFAPIIIATLYRNRIGFKTNALLIIGFGYMLAVTNIIIYGFGGAGIPVFFTVLVFATIFFDIKAGLLTVFICVFAMIVIAILYLTSTISLGVSLDKISTNLISWITAIAVLGLLGSLIVISYGLIQKKMLQSIFLTKQQASELQHINLELKSDLSKRQQVENELRKIRADLEKNVEKRTEELRLKNEELLKNNMELERINMLFVDREFRIKDLKNIIKKLERNRL